MSADLVNVVRIKSDGRIDPKCLLKAVGESITGDLIASLIDRRIPFDSPYHISPPFQLQQRRLTLRNDPPLTRDENYTSR